MIDPTATHPLLLELNDALAIEGAEPVDLIVCCGTALGILGLVQRPTRDVDVISGWSSATLQIVQIDCFPPAVERAIVRVADAHSELKSSGITNAKPWVNLGPRGLLDFGLPLGCTGRLTPRTIVPAPHAAASRPARPDRLQAVRRCGRHPRPPSSSQVRPASDVPERRRTAVRH
jgi:hypothetical protein